MVNRADVQQLLKFLDKNGDGKVNTFELKAFLDGENCPLDKQKVEQFIKVNDKDGDGQLNLDELVDILSQ